MSKVYVIADLHLGHKKLAALRGFATVDEHDQAIVEAWNSVVTKRDVVYVLGDIFDPSLLLIMKGIKKLAMGNHDQNKMEIYTSIFTKVRAMFEYDGCILSHIPVHPGQLEHRYRLNVHGHTHTYRLQDPRYIPTSVEQCPGMKPMLLNSLLAGK